MPGPIRARILGSGPMTKGIIIITAMKNKSPINEEACGAKVNLRSRQNSAFMLLPPDEVKIFLGRSYGFLECRVDYVLQRQSYLLG